MQRTIIGLAAVGAAAALGATNMPPAEALRVFSCDLGLTQGEFGMRVVRKANVERLMPATVTAQSALDRLADLGFAPADGWRSENLLSRPALDSAYDRFLDVMDVDDRMDEGSWILLYQEVSAPGPAEGAPAVLSTWVYNAGLHEAREVRVALDLPEGVAATPPGPAYADGVWALDSLPAGAAMELPLEIKAAAGTSGRRMPFAARVAQADPPQAAAYTGEVARSGMIVKGPAPVVDLRAVLTADNVIPLEKDVVAFTVIVTNRGPDAATAIEVRAMLPTGLTFEAASGPYTDGVWRLDRLNPGGTVRWTNTAKVETEENVWVLTNQVVASCAENDADALSNTGSVRVLVRLIDRLAFAAWAALVPTTTERQPISPARPLRR